MNITKNNVDIKIFTTNEDKNTRYFKTPYFCDGLHKILLHMNLCGETPSKEWVRSQIKGLNPGKCVIISGTIEITKAEFKRLKLLPDSNQLS